MKKSLKDSSMISLRLRVIGNPLQALIFDSQYDSYRGIVVFIRVVNGFIDTGMKIKFMAENAFTTVEEVGVLNPKMIKKDRLVAGEVGYIITGIKEVGNIGLVILLPAQRILRKSSFPDIKNPNQWFIADFSQLKDCIMRN